MGCGGSKPAGANEGAAAAPETATLMCSDGPAPPASPEPRGQPPQAQAQSPAVVAPRAVKLAVSAEAAAPAGGGESASKGTGSVQAAAEAPAMAPAPGDGPATGATPPGMDDEATPSASDTVAASLAAARITAHFTAKLKQRVKESRRRRMAIFTSLSDAANRGDDEAEEEDRFSFEDVNLSDEQRQRILHALPEVRALTRHQQMLILKRLASSSRKCRTRQVSEAQHQEPPAVLTSRPYPSPLPLARTPHPYP